jgi:hypothetical protein
MGKLIKEDCKNFSIYDLKNWGILKYDYYRGTIIWIDGYDGERDYIKYILNKNENHLELDYKIRKSSEEDWIKINYKIPLVTTTCHYGKKRYWFICPLYSNGRYCGRRVAKLYLAPFGDYFACRHCLNLSYDARNKNRKGRYRYFGKLLYLSKEVEKLEEEIKIKYRAGRPTKKYRKLLNKARSLGYVSEMVDKFL